MVLCLEKIFTDRDTLHRGEEFSVTCSYLEVYNEVRVCCVFCVVCFRLIYGCWLSK